MRLFYIDYENVMDSGLNGVAKLTESDAVKIYYSEDAQRMSFGTHRRIIESKAVFAYHKISPELKTVKNAVDISIMKDIEEAMKSDKGSEYYVVSKDNDYDRFIKEKTKKKYIIKRVTEVCQASANTDNSKSAQNSKAVTTDGKSNKNAVKQNEADLEEVRKKEHAIRTYIGQHLKDYKEYKEEIVKAYVDSSTKHELNNKLQKSLKNEKVSEILAALKSFIKDMPGG